jgi:hypothetical protein
VNAVFTIVAVGLDWLAACTGLTYVEINIIVYFMAIPFVFAAMLDGILRRHWLKLAVVAGWALALFAIPDFNAFSERLFAASVTFLMLFGRIGLDYTAASVVVCVIVPGLVFAGLAAGWVWSILRRRWGASGYQD